MQKKCVAANPSIIENKNVAADATSMFQIKPYSKHHNSKHNHYAVIKFNTSAVFMILEALPRNAAAIATPWVGETAKYRQTNQILVAEVF